MCDKPISTRSLHPFAPTHSTLGGEELGWESEERNQQLRTEKDHIAKHFQARRESRGLVLTHLTWSHLHFARS